MTTLRLTAKLTVALAAAEVAAAFVVPNALIPKAPSVYRHRRFATTLDTTESFEIDSILPMGRLVVSFEPLSDDEPSKPPPSPAPPAPEEYKPPNEVFTGVHLPIGKVPPRVDLPAVKAKVFGFLAPALGVFPTLQGQLKSDGFKVAHELFVGANNLAENIPDPENYKFFGNGDHAKNLVHLLKTNPFMTSCLTPDRYGFELMSYDPDDPDAKKSTASLYRKVMGTLDGAGRRVNIKFDQNMIIIGLEVYDDVKGIMFINALDEIEYWASSALYNMLFYASTVHAVIHVLHYLMTSGMQHASEDFEAMNTWATTYAENVVAKYVQVGTILITDPPLFAPKISSALTYAILTGPAGFGSSHKLRPILKDMLDMWGKSPTASGWLDTMQNIPEDSMAAAGILTEFKKHYDLVKPFAKDTAKALRKIDGDKYTIAELRMKEYLKTCGSFESNIDTVESWIELMSVTGIVHGSTISYSRMIGSADILRWRDIQLDTWDAGDINVMFSVLATVTGMEEGRHVMMSREDYDHELRTVLDCYDEKADALKEAYRIEIMKDRDVFNNYGWILSDFCPDGVDGKQLTIATYI